MFGGLGNDFIHGGAGDDALSGAEAMAISYLQKYTGKTLTSTVQSDFYHPFNPGDALRFNASTSINYDPARRADEFALYDEYNPLRKIMLNLSSGAATPDGSGSEFFLNFANADGPLDTKWNGGVPTDGDDIIFGDLGNDWIVGGTGRDDLYGGWGADLMNGDDNLNTAGGIANDTPDPNASYEDRAFGGAGRDILIGNTGGDRLMDWAGEFNSFLVPFAPFGLSTISRSLQPGIAEFLYSLSASDGADWTRGTDVGNVTRNGEPNGEMGLITQKDAAWHDQTGAPYDPQPGNVPGGSRDVLRSSSFNTGAMQAFAPDTGTWTVQNGALQVSASSLHADAVAVYDIGDSDGLPSYFEVQASIRVIKPLAGWKANSYIIFDYESPTAFKFTGIDIASNKLVMGHRDASGWIVDKQAPFQAKPDAYYNMLLSVNGLTASLIVDNTTVFTQTYNARVVDGYSYGLNWGLVGFGSDNSQGAMDDVAVQVLPPQITFNNSEDFSDGVADLFTGAKTGTWAVQGGQFAGSLGTGATSAYSLVSLPGVNNLQTSAYLDLSSSITTQGQAGIIFDQYSPQDFKFAAIDAVADQVVIGHYTARSGWVIDRSVAKVIDAGVAYNLDVTLRGTTVNVTVNGQTIVSNAFNAVTVDGRFGVLTRSSGTSFDNVTIKTDDLAFLTSNRPPVAKNDNATTPAGTPVTIPVLANDLDADGNTLTVSAFTQPASGTLVLNATGTFTYTPRATFTGVDTFTYTISDGATLSNSATVTVQVNGTSNTPPVASNDSARPIKASRSSFPS